MPSFRAVDLNGRASSQAVAELAPGARVVKAFNHLGAAVLDANPQADGGRRLLFLSGQDADARGRAAGEVLADLSPKARVIKAFNDLVTTVLDADPQTEGGRRVLFVSGEDAEAKKIVSDLIASLGFAAVDIGGVTEGRLVQFPGGPLAILNLVKF